MTIACVEFAATNSAASVTMITKILPHSFCTESVALGLMNLVNISRVTIALNVDIYAAPVLCIAANAQTAKRPTSHGVESDNKLINCGTRVLSFALSMTPLSMRRFPPTP